ncbi:CGNR zinc finger domain-containing protein [Streptomyces triticiradicis]|uniref:CGNR zinc finger domain-containing protein n=1 Tax=Streptomyces triticiradicis TaxID=2651189 RepID=A0A7J5DMZ7_9ACTN|nr:CGNR zinc finger domain-containing protein [Streptomyces triticiradicis]KAB1990131.1 CGNR zinc finger domain-containing protein [Streptomyces triticiradicis]
MAPTPEPATARFRGGAGRLCLDFMRTLRLRGTDDATEELPTAEDLADWVAQLGPYPADTAVPVPTAAVLGQARALREAVHTLLTAARGDGGAAACPPGERELLNAAAAGAPPVPRLDENGTTVHGSGDPVGAVLVDIARDAITLATSPALAQVRSCSGPRCTAWFLDTSRPGNRRWCSMETCGNKSKKSTWRAKHTTAPDA